ncbi:hypothetical protein AYO44_12710 [Planctomycetaceae bacterium SCGC AG-212-F19]|nr:hypothetical protein AYO44_12710 [Planctomycetaceae bacterium SCGC AG-212-F19]
MSIRTWLLYLIGNRQAILELAADRRALWVGALFVLSAGLARDYDGEDLVHDPWHLLLPYAASLLTSLLLFGITWVPGVLKAAPGPSLPTAFRSFLGLFWLTAPLAWLYGIPYERWLTPLEATQANLITLGIVAAWRVYLMIRVVSVLMGFRAWQACFLVLFLADAEALLALWFVPRPIIPIMGGIRMTESEFLVARVGDTVQAIALLTLLLWIIGAIVATASSKPAWQAPMDEPKQSGKGLIVMALGALTFWLALLPFTQPEQFLRRRVENALKEGRIAEALAEMSAHQRSDFPPHWDPPPRSGYGETTPSVGAVMAEIRKAPPAPWVAEVFEEKIRQKTRP